MATLDIGLGEKGVSGVPGPPVVLVVPADVRFRTRPLVLIGVMMLEEPEVREDFDCELESVGGGLATFGARSLLENRPMAAAVYVGVSVVGAPWVQSASIGRSASGRYGIRQRDRELRS